MTHQIVVSAVSATASGPTEAAGATPGRAAPEAVRKFEQLMYSPAHAATPSLQLATPAAASKGGMQMYVQHLSQRWEAGQAALQSMLSRGNFTTSELMQTQIQMINCALDVEVSSKCASIFENGVQTLVQRGGA
jgi:Type III secretion basal body protein I, YscI, HrpB, PscI